MAEEHVCKYEGLVQETHKMVKDMHKTFYEGNGKDPITVQIDRNTTGRKVIYWLGGAITLCVLTIIGKLVYNALST